MRTFLVCGGRNYQNRANVFKVLDKHHDMLPIEMIVNGGAKGADSLATEWAKSRCVPCLTCWADWNKHGKTAGLIRNKEMLRYCPQIVIAFPGGTGTQHMVRTARDADFHVIEYDDEGNFFMVVK